MVAPSMRLASAVQEHQRTEAVGSFLWSVSWEVAKVLEAGGEVPGFKRCTRYKGSGGIKSKDDKRHIHCTRCNRGVICSLSPTALFDRYAADWYREMDPQPPTRIFEPPPGTARAVPSRARVAEDEEVVCAVLQDFTDHGKGAYVGQPEPSSLSSRTALFFFVPRASIDMAAWADLCERQRQTEEEERQRAGTKGDELLAQRAAARLALVRGFFMKRPLEPSPLRSSSPAP
jgi:hypothetical protein